MKSVIPPSQVLFKWFSFSNIVAMGFVVALVGCETAKQPGADVDPNAIKRSETAAPATKASTDAAIASANAPIAQAPVAKPVEPPPVVVVKPEQLFAEGKDLYERGDYKNAIRKLGAARDAADDNAVIKQNSLKYLAFSYCVSNQKPLCKNQFTTLLKLAPAFQLSRGEAGHPLWGPVFKEVKDGKDVKETKVAPPVKTVDKASK
jgi:hypothetical protein